MCISMRMTDLQVSRFAPWRRAALGERAYHKSEPALSSQEHRTSPAARAFDKPFILRSAFNAPHASISLQTYVDNFLRFLSYSFFRCYRVGERRRPPLTIR